MSAGELLVERLLDQVTVAWGELAEQHRESCRRCARRGSCPTSRLADRQRRHATVR
jgi:hypothetical protein